jgi:anaerobic magnesium-protoporphyrin IX monomethyl ester cyclase
MKNKILLIRPKNEVKSDVGVPIPLGLISLASVLKENGFEVKIIDAMSEKNYLDSIKKELDGSILVGLTALTSEIKNAIEILKFIKRNSKIPTLMGGWHATLFPLQTCEDPLVDFVVMNEGEIALLRLAQALQKNKSYEKIPGLVYKKGNELKSNPFEYLDLDKLSFLPYDLVDLEKYVPKSEGKRWISYQSSRGCPHNCSFCVNKVTNNTRYRKRSAEKVLEDLKILIEKYNVGGIVFIDDNFFVDKKRVIDICKGMVENNLKIRWRAECRADYFREGLVDDETLGWCEKAGLNELTIGAESGSEKMLKFMCKGISLDQILRSAILCKKYNIIPDYSFIIGLPTETKKDVLLTLKLIKKLLKINSNMLGGINTYRPYPKSEIAELLIKQGTFVQPKTFRDWSKGKHISIYTERTLKQPWQFSPNYIESVSFYVTLALSLIPIKRNINIKNIIDFFFSYLANIRLNLNFFSFTLDQKIYTLYRTLKKKIYLKLR